MPPILSFEDVNFTYQEAPILLDVSVSVGQGEWIGIIGPNGGGKTTLLKLIMGFLKPTTGKISLFGSSPQHAINEIGYVPQVMRFDRQFPISVYELALSGRLSRLPWHGVYSNEDHQITD